ncbi:MAG: choline transporter, partial [Paraglaciecola sp.]
NEATANKFVAVTARSAMESVSAELALNQVESKIVGDVNKLTLHVDHGPEHSFVYGVKCAKHQQPNFTSEQDETNVDNSNEDYYRVEVHLAEGGQDYDIMGWSKQAVINDMIDHYQKHLHFLHLVR